MKHFNSFIGANWNTVPASRAAWALNIKDKTIEPCEEPILDLKFLLEWADTLPKPTLIMLNAGLGVAAGMADANDWGLSYKSFADLLRKNGLTFDFLNPVRRVQEWTPHQPFIHLPAGQGSFSGLKRKAEGTLYREFENDLNCKPVFILSGVPSCIGGSSRNVWASLPGLLRDDSIGLWPFDGDFENCASSYPTVLCEAYPRLALQISLAENLPFTLKKPRQRDDRWRSGKLSEVLARPWFSETNFSLVDLADASENIHSFDALMLIFAAIRMIPMRISSPENVWEGAVLGQDFII